MALVIFWVDLTEAIRFLRSLSEAIGPNYSRNRGLDGEVLLEAFDRRLELHPQIVAERLLSGDLGQNISVLGAQGRKQALFECAHRAHRQVVEIALSTREDHRD